MAWIMFFFRSIQHGVKPLINGKYAMGKERIYNIYIAYLVITAIREISYADDFIHISRSSGAIESKTQSLVRVTCSM